MRLRWMTVPSFFVSVTACATILDVDRFQKQASTSTGPGGDSGVVTPTISYFDVEYRATGMVSHIGELFEIRIVDRDNSIQAKAVYSNVVKPDFSISMKRVVPTLKPPYRIDFWADHNNTFRYDGIKGGIDDKDHAWRRQLVNPPVEEDVRFDPVTGYSVNFAHNTTFDDILIDPTGKAISPEETLLPFELKIKGDATSAGKTIETRVVEKGTGRLVALHRRGAAPTEYDAQVLGVLDEGPYDITVFADLDDDGRPSKGDRQWKLTLESTNGIKGELNLATTESDLIESADPE